MPPLHLVSLFLFALFGPEPGESVLTRWADLMRGCEGDCYYYPEVDGTVVTSGIGRRNHECKNFIHGKLVNIISIMTSISIWLLERQLSWDGHLFL